MTAQLINLRQARKARDRAAKEAEAAENRIKFGRTKAERQNVMATSELEKRRLDGQQLDPADRQPDGGGEQDPKK